ncbi:SGNH/GDSL hydrolase family protein [Leifsonia sp. EB34]|uniref:SGNH/GDSL hydrolase family protein n=1 Tax=Leifsonia sp. EB34 TaxID=3156303 RepID=UPI0035192DC0
MVAAFAAVALGLTALFGASAAAFADTPPGLAYVALGDSEAAGTGIPGCVHAPDAYPAVLAASYGQSPFFSAACAGATTADVYTQLGYLSAHGAIGGGTGLVTLTVGINDLGWQNTLLACSGANVTAACLQSLATTMTSARSLPGKISALVTAIRAVAPNAKIRVTDYPMLFGFVSGTCNIGSIGGVPVNVTATQATLVDGALVGVGAFIRQGVAGAHDANAQFVGVIAGFLGHGLCTSDPWIFGFGPVFLDGLHANAQGEAEYAKLIARTI